MSQFSSVKLATAKSIYRWYERRRQCKYSHCYP